MYPDSIIKYLEVIVECAESLHILPISTMYTNDKVLACIWFLQFNMTNYVINIMIIKGCTGNNVNERNMNL